MSRHTVRNIVIIVAVVFVVRTILPFAVGTSTVINFVIGAVAGVIALVIIDFFDRKEDVGR